MPTANQDSFIGENPTSSTLTPELSSNTQPDEIARPEEKNDSNTIDTNELSDLYYLADIITITTITDEDEDNPILDYTCIDNADHRAPSSESSTVHSLTPSHNYTHTHTHTHTYIHHDAQTQTSNQTPQHQHTNHLSPAQTQSSNQNQHQHQHQQLSLTSTNQTRQSAAATVTAIPIDRPQNLIPEAWWKAFVIS